MRLFPRLGLILTGVLLGAVSLLAPPSQPSEAFVYPSAYQAAGTQDEHVTIVRQRNKFFDPPVVVIHEGDTVMWVNETGGGWHDVVSDEGKFESGRMDPGDTFSHTFEQPGVYSYHCHPHVIDGMQGVVIVLPKGAPLPDPLPAPPVPTSSPALAEPIPLGTPDTIQTVAGSGGNGGLATAASLYLPEGVALDDAGRLYIADTENCQIRRVEPSGTIVSILGHESCGNSMGGDADLGPWLHTNHPRGVTVGPDGALYLADTINCRVRSVQEGGKVTTIAGSGSCRASGDGGPAADAGLAPWDLAWDSQGNLYIADAFNCRIRKVEAGVITTVAGDGTCGFSGDDGPATEASLFFPRDVAVGSDGTLYVADTANCRVRRVAAGTAVIETVAGNGSCGYSGDGGPAAQAGLHPWALAVEADGGVLVADRENCRLRRFVPGGAIATVAGSGVCGFSGDGGAAEPPVASSHCWPAGRPAPCRSDLWARRLPCVVRPARSAIASTAGWASVRSPACTTPPGTPPAAGSPPASPAATAPVRPRRGSAAAPATLAHRLDIGSVR